MVPAKEPEAAEPEIPPPPPAPVPEGGKPNYRMITLIGIAIIAIIIGIVLLPGLTSSPAGGTGSNLTTTAITTPADTLPHNNAKNPRDTRNYHPGNSRTSHGIDTPKRCMGESHVSRNIYRINWYAQRPACIDGFR